MFANPSWAGIIDAAPVDLSLYALEFRAAYRAVGGEDDFLASSWMLLIPDDLDDAVQGQRFEWLAVTPEHAREAGKLPRIHGDPFDRIIIAQAFVEGAVVVSADRWFPGYGVPLLW